MKWMEAVKMWNEKHHPGKWCMPRKGSPEHAEVKAIMAGEEPKPIKKFKLLKKKVEEKPEEKAEDKKIYDDFTSSPPPIKKFKVRKPAEKARLLEIGKSIDTSKKMERVKKFLKKVMELRREAKAEKDAKKRKEKEERVLRMMEMVYGMKLSKFQEAK